jgi:hypothetical protein
MVATVTSSSAGPLTGVQVFISEPGPGGGLWLATTDASGRFTFQQDGRYSVGIAPQNVPPGCTQPPSQIVTLVQQGLVQVDIPLTCGAAAQNMDHVDFTADAAARDLLGAVTLSDAQRAYLDRHGNHDGSYDLGDLLAFLDRTHAKLAPGLLGAMPRSKERAP